MDDGQRWDPRDVVRLPSGETVWRMPTGHVVTRAAAPPLDRFLVARRARARRAEVQDAWLPPHLASGYQARDDAAPGVVALAAAVDGEMPPADGQERRFDRPPPF